jgi:hypothetical protein
VRSSNIAKLQFSLPKGSSGVKKVTQSAKTPSAALQACSIGQMP